MAAQKKFNGTIKRIKIGTKVVAEEISCEVTLTAAEIPTNSKDDGNWYDFIQGEKSWEIKGSAQTDYTAGGTTKYNYADIVGAWIAGTTVSVSVTTGVVGDFLISGSAMFTNVTDKAGRNEVAGIDFSLKGKGALTLDEIEA